MRGNIDCLGGHILLGSRNMGHSAPPLSIMKWKRAEERERGGGCEGASGRAKAASYFRSGGGGGLFLTELIILSEGAGLETGGCDRPNGRRHPFANHPSRAAASPPSPAVKHLPYGAAWQRASLCISTGGNQRRAPSPPSPQ